MTKKILCLRTPLILSLFCDKYRLELNSLAIKKIIELSFTYIDNLINSVYEEDFADKDLILELSYIITDDKNFIYDGYVLSKELGKYITPYLLLYDDFNTTKEVNFVDQATFEITISNINTYNKENK